MKRKMRFLAGTLALVMVCRYSEMGVLIANAEARSSHSYAANGDSWHSMMAEEIQLYYGTLNQYGRNQTEVTDTGCFAEALTGMLYDRGETELYYNSFKEQTEFETDFYSQSNMLINSEKIKISYLVSARLSQQINGTSYEQTGTGVLYTRTGDVTINVRDAQIRGLIYAPEGTVTINAGSVELTGLIVAKKIVIHADSIEERPERDLKAVYEELSVEFCPEILVSCNDENQVEVYAGNSGITGMEIYARYNESTEFQKVGEAKGNEYQFALPENTDSMDIRVRCTNLFGQEALSDIASLGQSQNGFGTVTADCDEDGIPDGYEIWDLGTDAWTADSDGDGLTDGYEVLYSHTDPLRADSSADTDGDGLTALQECELGTNTLYADTDFDGLWDSKDGEPLTTEILADQSVYQSGDFEPELGRYDCKKVYLDIYGNRQVQIFNVITKDEYYDDNAGSTFLRVKDSEGQIETTIFGNGEEAQIETTEYDSEGRKQTWAVNGDVYRYVYDDAMNTAATYLNGNLYHQITYDEQDNPIKCVYANGDEMGYEYDENGRLEGIFIDGERSYKYQYENDMLTAIEDVRTGKSSEMAYDADSNLTSYRGVSGFEKQVEYSETEEEDQYTERYSYQGNERSVTFDFQGDEESTRISSAFSNGAVLQEKREIEQTEKYLMSGAGELLLEDIETTEEGLVTRMKNLCGDYEYQYDENGNLTEVKKNGEKSIDYFYDENLQLTRSVDYEKNLVYLYSYDRKYNLLQTEVQDMDGKELDKHQYGYGEDITKGLRSYKGNEISYDESGNPVNYWNDMEFRWENGRMLSEVISGENNIRYEYNGEGIRIRKSVNGKPTEYIRDEAGILMGEVSPNGEIWYLYDGNGELAGFEWNGADYYYVRNAWKDVQGIADRAGKLLCTYSYDAWGAVTGIAGDEELGQVNPVRYRGYYYDRETSLYYLMTRYYDPETKRFLNKDSLDNETNLYQYCYNNPVVNSDYTGMATYGCSDEDVEPQTYVSGYWRDDVSIGSTHRAEYSYGQEYAYFNCYLWALNMIVVDRNSFETFIYNGNKIMGTPGYW